MSDPNLPEGVTQEDIDKQWEEEDQDALRMARAQARWPEDV